MKKYFLLSIVIYSFGFSSSVVEYGLKFGLNGSKFIGNFAFDPKSSYPIGYFGGISFEKRCSKRVSVQGALYYEQAKSKIQLYTMYEGIRNNLILTNYVHLPMVMKLYTSKNCFPNTTVGIEVGYLLNAQYRWDDQIYREHGSRNIEGELKPFDIALIFGFSKHLKILKHDISVEIAFKMGMTEYHMEEIGKWTYNKIQISIDYLF